MICQEMLDTAEDITAFISGKQSDMEELGAARHHCYNCLHRCDDDEEDISGNIQNQRAIMETFAQESHLPNSKFFFDDGFCVVTFTRPAFMEIMELAEQGLVATLVVKDHSRLGRNRLVVGQLLERTLCG